MAGGLPTHWMMLILVSVAVAGRQESEPYPRGVETGLRSSPFRRIGAPANTISLLAEDKVSSFPELDRFLPGGVGVGARSLLRTCAPDPEAVALQKNFTRLAQCACLRAGLPDPTCSEKGRNVRPRLTSRWGIGAEVGSLFVLFAHVFEKGVAFVDAQYRRPLCPTQRMSDCLSLLPTAPHCPEQSAPSQLTQSSDYAQHNHAWVPEPYAGRKSLFWWTSQVAARILRPGPTLLKHLRTLQHAWGWQRGDRVLGLHVRRGDTCMVDERNASRGFEDGAFNPKAARRCDSLRAYAPYARAMVAAHGLGAVFIATDDEAIIAEARANAFELFGVSGPSKVYAIELNRSMYYLDLMDAVLKGKQSQGDEGETQPAFDPRADALAAMTDLLLLADCDALVVKFTSNLGRQALALSNAFKGGDCVVPYLSLDSPWCAGHGKKVGRSYVGLDPSIPLAALRQKPPPIVPVLDAFGTERRVYANEVHPLKYFC